jgi:hypothetical protein
MIGLSKFKYNYLYIYSFIIKALIVFLFLKLISQKVYEDSSQY